MAAAVPPSLLPRARNAGQHTPVRLHLASLPALRTRQLTCRVRQRRHLGIVPRQRSDSGRVRSSTGQTVSVPFLFPFALACRPAKPRVIAALCIHPRPKHEWPSPHAHRSVSNLARSGFRRATPSDPAQKPSCAPHMGFRIENAGYPTRPSTAAFSSSACQTPLLYVSAAPQTSHARLARDGVYSRLARNTSQPCAGARFAANRGRRGP